MTDMFGLFFGGSSKSIALQLSLESKLRDRVDCHGSPECAMTWKTTVTPSGPPICRLAASARRTYDRAYTGPRFASRPPPNVWPTPQKTWVQIGLSAAECRKLSGRGGKKLGGGTLTAQCLILDIFRHRGTPPTKCAKYLLTDSGAELRPNPEFIRWLMGFPPGWLK